MKAAGLGAAVVQAAKAARAGSAAGGAWRPMPLAATAQCGAAAVVEWACGREAGAVSSVALALAPWGRALAAL